MGGATATAAGNAGAADPSHYRGGGGIDNAGSGKMDAAGA